MLERIPDILIIAATATGALVAALWGGMVIWTFRDIRARSRDILAQILATLLVAILTLPGLVVYFMLRPRETLAEAYDRALEEEALLQAIEEPETCPGCGQRVKADYLLCPTCHTRLKKPCSQCGRALHLRWSICPYCGASTTPQVLEPVPTPSSVSRPEV